MPEKLTRETAGHYRSADGRFGVADEGGSWWVRDEQQTNEFGMPRLIGPLATLNAARDAIAEARDQKIVPLPKPPRGKRGAKSSHSKNEGSAEGTKPTKRRKAAEPDEPEQPPEPAWIERELDAPRRDHARRLIRVLSDLGFADVEQLVRTDLLGLSPAIAQALLRRRIQEEAVDPWRDPQALAAALAGADVTSGDPGSLAAAVAASTVEDVLRVIDAGGASGKRARDLPGWKLVERDGEREIHLLE